MAGGEEEGSRSLEDTPTWAVATIVFIMIVVSILIEQALHLLHKYLNKKRRKSLIKALDQIKAELMLLGFLSLLLTVCQKYIAKICIPKSAGQNFLPCHTHEPEEEVEAKCAEQGKLSLISEKGVQQLQYLIFILALSHVISCFLTFSLGMLKMKRWESWEEQTKTLEYEHSPYKWPKKYILIEAQFSRRTNAQNSMIHSFFAIMVFLWRYIWHLASVE